MRNASKSEKIIFCILSTIVVVIMIAFRNTIDKYLEMMLYALAKFSYNIGAVWSTVILIALYAFVIGLFTVIEHKIRQMEKTDEEDYVEDK